MTRRQFVAFSLALFPLCGVSLAGQSLTGALKGRIYDVTGAVFPGANVTVLSSRTGEVRTTKAGPNGEYSLEGLKYGKYELRVDSPGFHPDVRLIWIPANIELKADSVLQPAGTHGYGDVYVIDKKNHRIVPDGPEYRGAIRGHMSDEYAGRISKVPVIAENLDTHHTFTSESDKHGAFVIGGLSKGTYKVHVDSKGYWSDFQSAVIEYGIDPVIQLKLKSR